MMLKLSNATITFLLLCLSLCAHAQSAAALEAQARKATDNRERMTLFYKAAEKYMGSNAIKASQMAHQSYTIALEINENAFAAKAAYLNADGFARQAQWNNAKFRYNRSRESAEKAKDNEGQARALAKMSEMAKKEGNAGEAELYANQAKELRGGSAATRPSTSPNTEGVPSTGGGRATMTPTANPPRSTPSNQVEMNNMREYFKRQTEQLERDRQRLVAEISLLRNEKIALNDGMTDLRNKERDLTEQTSRAKQTIEEKNQQIVQIESQKSQLDKVNSRKQKLLEALRDEKKAEALAFEQVRREQEFELEKAHNLRNILILASLAFLAIAFLIFKRFKENQKQKRMLESKNKLIEDERQRSDELLLNILPGAIADELKTNGKAKAQRYERASVLFADFKNFTTISATLSPEQLVNELDTYFKAFDFIVAQYKLEKIKTIGDAYMCASGLSDRISTPVNIVKAALEMQQFLNEMKQDKMRKGEPYFEARIGINTGPVVAGVVGVKKFAYDIWGDTVNVAARVQDACEPGYINISESTFKEIQYSFKTFYRGKLPVKNRGEIEMHYVQGVSS